MAKADELLKDARYTLTKFQRWFEKQWGWHPKQTGSEVEKRLRNLRQELQRYEALADDIKRYNIARSFALYAWQIKDREKK